MMVMAEPTSSLSDRIKTGIDGLDNILYGGIPTGSQVLVCGGPGSGKTLLTLEILYHNAKNGINGTFLALEESQESIIKNFKQAFPELTEIDELISSNKIVLGGNDISSKVHVGNDSEAYTFGNVLSEIETIIKSNDSKCVVVDSISLLKLMLGDLFIYRKSMVSLADNLKRIGVTGFLTLELTSMNRKDIAFSPEFFIFDGTIAMYQNLEDNKRVFAMEILKMRGSNHSLSLAPYEVTGKGFKVFTISEI